MVSGESLRALTIQRIQVQDGTFGDPYAIERRLELEDRLIVAAEAFADGDEEHGIEWLPTGLVAEQEGYARTMRAAVRAFQRLGLPADDAPWPTDALEAVTLPAPVAPARMEVASESELAHLPGVGLVLAKRVVAERARKGGFSSVDEVAARLGLKPHLAARFVERVAVGDAGASAPAVRPSGRVLDL